MKEEEVSGLIIRTRDDHIFYIVDINYGCRIGIMRFEEGPGWVLDQIDTNFLDLNQMKTIHDYFKDREPNNA